MTSAALPGRACYSAGGLAGEAAITGTLNGRSMGVLITFREVTDGKGGPLESLSIVAAAACLSLSPAAAKSC